MKKVLLLLALPAFFWAGSVIAAVPAAADHRNETPGCSSSTAGFLGLPTWYKYLHPNYDASSGECLLDINLTSPAFYGSVLFAVFEIILRLGAIVAVGFVIAGGFWYMLSQGEPEKTRMAKNTIINALVGLAITMLSVALVNLVAGSVF